MRVLITGGCGFIGSNLVAYLRERHPDWYISVLDGLTYAGRMENLPILSKDISSTPNFQFYYGNVCNAALVAEAMKGIDLCWHMAAESHVARSLYDDRIFTETDVLGTQTILAAALQAKITRLIYMSSSEVYGTAVTTTMDEYHSLDPTSPYAAAKAGADRLAYSYWVGRGLPAVIARPFNCIWESVSIPTLIDGLFSIKTAAEVYEAVVQQHDVRLVSFQDNGCTIWCPVQNATKREHVGSVVYCTTKLGRETVTTPDHVMIRKIHLTGPTEECPMKDIQLEDYLPVMRHIDLPKTTPLEVDVWSVLDAVGESPLDWRITFSNISQWIEDHKEILLDIFSRQRSRRKAMMVLCHTRAERVTLSLCDFLATGESVPKSYKLRHAHMRSAVWMPGSLQLNDAFMWLLGFIVAEGMCSESSKGRFLRLASDTEFLIQAQRMFEEMNWPSGQFYKPNTKRPYPLVIVNDSSVVRILLALGLPRKSTEARVPPIVFGAGEQRIRAFLAGYHAGDGSKVAPYWNANTASDGLATDLVYLLNSLGFVGARGYYSNRIEGRDKTYHHHRVTLYGVNEKSPDRATTQNIRFQANNDVVWLPVTSCIIKQQSGNVYDFTLAAPHNFVCGDGIFVHNCYGPKQHLEKVIPRFITDIIQDQTLTIHGSGSACRDFTYVTDLCAALELLGTIPNLDGEVFNIGSGTDRSVLSLSYDIQRLMGNCGPNVPDLIRVEDRPGQVALHRANANKIRSLGWEPRVSWDDGLAATIDWYKTHRRDWESQLWLRRVPILMASGKVEMY